MYCSQRCARVVAERNRPCKYRFRKGRRRLLTAEERVETRAYLQVLAGDPCCYCGAPSEHKDHIHPVKLGGGETWDNFTAACGSCNIRKGAQPLLGYLLNR